MPLHVAAQAGSRRVVGWLLEQGVRPDCRTRFVTPMHARQTPLHLAAAAGHTAVLETLLAAAAEVSVHDAQRRSPLWLAARHGRADAVGCLLARGADPESRDAQGRTPLHAALLGPAARDSATTPRAEAESWGSWDPAAALRLLERGADPHATCPKEPAGFTPLHRCVALGLTARPVAEALVRAGADPALADPREGLSARDRARAGDDSASWEPLLN